MSAWLIPPASARWLPDIHPRLRRCSQPFGRKQRQTHAGRLPPLALAWLSSNQGHVSCQPNHTQRPWKSKQHASPPPLLQHVFQLGLRSLGTWKTFSKRKESHPATQNMRPDLPLVEQIILRASVPQSRTKPRWSVCGETHTRM